MRAAFRDKALAVAAAAAVASAGCGGSEKTAGTRTLAEQELTVADLARAAGTRVSSRSMC
jgi:hypothetical protein